MPDRLPTAWWLVLAIYVPCISWLALRTRVFMDQVWATEYGRRFLEPETTHSMYMLADGQTLPPHSWLGSMLTELAMRLSQGLICFRLIAAAAAIVLAYSLLRLLQRQGVATSLSLLVACAFLFDASITQSVVVGRADTLAMALIFGGMNLAAWAAHPQHATIRTLNWMALGYSLCALAPAMWSTSLLLGPIAALHWAASLKRMLREEPALSKTSVYLRLLLTPALVLVVSFALPFAAWASALNEAAVPALQQLDTSLWVFLDYALRQTAVTICLMLAGAFALTQIKPRWVAAVLVLGCTGVLTSGFYPFRVPYLAIYMVVAIAIFSAQTKTANTSRSWDRLIALGLVVAVALFGVRMLFSFANQAPPRSEPWFSNLPASTTIADFSWDFYAIGRAQQRTVMRSMPGAGAEAVSTWLKLARPDFVVYASDARSTWALVDDLPSILAPAQYCKLADIDWSGRAVDVSAWNSHVPSALLWRMGMFRDYGPYALWARCADNSFGGGSLQPSSVTGHN